MKPTHGVGRSTATSKASTLVITAGSFAELLVETTTAGLSQCVECTCKSWPIALHRDAEQWNLGRTFKEAGIEKWARCIGLPPRTAIAFEPPVLRALFQQEALRRGILTHGNHMLSLAHSEIIFEEALAAYRQVFAVMADALEKGDVEARLEGPPLQPVVRDL